MPEKCHTHNCDQPAIARGLCQAHYKRFQRHGNVKQTRPVDWGSREKHSAYKTWCGLRRYHRLDVDARWLENFWHFVEDVGDKPSAARAHRPDSSKPWSKENFYWKDRREGPADRREYMRVWRAKARAASPDYYANSDLKKLYGVTLDWYMQKMQEQGGVCAICGEAEKTVIRGREISLSVDHCHTTGTARGLLCTPCNRGLGLFKDKIDHLESAVRYLRRSQAE